MMSSRLFSRLFLFAIAVFSFSGLSYQAFAADEKIEGLSEEQEEASESVQDKIKTFTQDFDSASTKHFYALYGSYNLIQVVNDVRGQVGNAIEKCSDANPDMKESLNTRYKTWDKAIGEIMDDANANVDNMIAVQDYAKPREIKKVLKFVDKKREINNDEVEKFPVTSPEACQYLQDKMDDTQENLTSLLKSTLVALPNVMINAEDPKKDNAQGEENPSQDGE